MKVKKKDIFNEVFIIRRQDSKYVKRILRKQNTILTLSLVTLLLVDLCFPALVILLREENKLDA